MTVTHATEASDRMLWSFNMLMDVKASAEDTGGALTVIDSRLTAAANPPMHVHHTSDEGFYVLEGEVEFFLADASCIARPGALCSARAAFRIASRSARPRRVSS